MYLLVRAFEAAVEGVLEDGLLSFDEENALARYLDHFGIDQAHADRNGAQTSMVQAAVIREITEGVVPQRQNLTGRVPFNLMKSEKLVWVMQDVDYLEIVTRRERRGWFQGLSIRITRGVYYRPSTLPLRIQTERTWNSTRLGTPETNSSRTRPSATRTSYTIATGPKATAA